jgi:hypothetical protein
MAKTKCSKPEKLPAMNEEFPNRLEELEAELRAYPSRAEKERALKAVGDPTAEEIGKECVVQFRLGGKVYAAGHSDVIYAGSNHSRGVRHIRFYADRSPVLDIEGDYEDQQFGSNFRFQNVDLYTRGAWEKDFIKLTDDLHHYKAKRRIAFREKRAAEHTGRPRRRSAS